MAQVGEQLKQAGFSTTELPIQNRPLISEERAAELEAVFKILGNRTRLRLIHALTKAGEMCVTELAETVNMKPQAVSNQLQRLTDRGILASKRNGINIFYRVVDPGAVNLMNRGLCLTEE